MFNQQQFSLVALFLFALQLLLVQPAYACSAGLDFNPVAEADVIVGGRISAWEELPADSNSPFTPIRLTLAVDQRFKGEADATLQFVDQSSLSFSGGQTVWAGSSGACGVFDSDPTGQYLVLGLDRWPDGAYRSNLMLLFFRGTQPAGADYEQAIARLTALAERLTPTAEPAPPTAVAVSPSVTPAPTEQPTREPVLMTPTAPAATVGESRPSPPVVLLVTAIGIGALGLALLALRGRQRLW